jgi:cystathionine beta-lyase/cystathionine gamma-synthase
MRLQKTNKGITEEAIVSFKDLYNLFAPSARIKKMYDLQMYAYDLYKIYLLRNELTTKNGRKIYFETPRNPDNNIRILDENNKPKGIDTFSFRRN